VKLTICVVLFIVAHVGFAQQTSPPDSSVPSDPTHSIDPGAQVQSPTPSSAQTAASGSASSQQDDLRCEHPADPHRRHHGCEEENFGWDETVAGGWNGIRDALRKVGLNPTISYIGALQTNATGGPHQVWSYAGLLTFSLGFDLKKLLKVPGLSAYAEISWGTGSNLTDVLHSTLPVNTIYSPGFYLGEIYLQQEFIDGRLQLLGGRLGAEDTFANLAVFANYVNYGINPGPVSIGTNDIAFQSPPPGVEWGVQTTYKFNRAFQMAAGMFNTNFYSASGKDNGTDFLLQEGNKGALVVAEIDYLRNQTSKVKRKPGEYGIGFVHDNNSFPTVIDPELRADTYSGVYVMGQQMVYQPQDASASQGLTIWATWTYNSKQLICPMPMFWGFGASYEGLIAARKRDIVSAGLISGKVSDYIPGTTAEELFELNYQWRHSRYLILTPHFEYIWKPSGYKLPGASVFGLQVSLAL
jgi:carbohydrate-selective porin OprB